MDARVVELFAGVGGFRLGLERAGWKTVFANQWEPGKTKQWAFDCYAEHFKSGELTNVDIATIRARDIPDHELLVGGFPCQDYSVATTQAEGIHGKKGVLWWEIYRILRAKTPPIVLLENVDRLLKSPTTQRGRDFGVMLWCLNNLGYAVEWRVVNAADYGQPQKRRRVFILAAQRSSAVGQAMITTKNPHSYLHEDGLFARCFPVVPDVLRPLDTTPVASLLRGLQETSDKFELPFRGAGLMVNGRIWTREATPRTEAVVTLGNVLQRNVSDPYFVPDEQVTKWRYLKGAKQEPRTAKNGFVYKYSEGPLPFPDSLDRPARTILTSEGGTAPSRFKHIVKDPTTGRLRVLTPVEVERLNGFPDDWTATGMPQSWRYFCMGNALVVGLIERIGHRLIEAWLTGGRPPSARREKPMRAPHQPSAGHRER